MRNEKSESESISAAEEKDEFEYAIELKKEKNCIV